MSNLLFFRRSYAYRHAARTELNNARMLPRGSQRQQALKRARALWDLARNEAWLEGQVLRLPHNDQRFAIAVATPKVGRVSRKA